MRGHCRHHVLATATLVAEATTEPEWALIDLGRYPGLVPGQQAIVGELYDVPDELWPQLDRVEAVHLGLYRRQEIPLNEPATIATTYLYTGAAAGADVGVRWTGVSEEARQMP